MQSRQSSKLWFSSFFPCLFKDIEYLFRKFRVGFFPIFLEVLFPVLCPWTAVVIHEARIGCSQLLRPSVRVLNIAQALDICIPAPWIVDGCAPRETICGADGRDERIRIVKDGFMVEPDKFAGRVDGGLPEFYSLHLVAEFEHRMGQCPALDLRRP